MQIASKILHNIDTCLRELKDRGSSLIRYFPIKHSTYTLRRLNKH